MARDVRIHSYDWNHDVGEISLAPQNNISITNHSYGPRAGWDYDGGVKPSDTCSQATSEGIAPVHWRWYGNYQELEDSNFGRYDRSTPEFDKIVQANVRLSIFVSAGNQRGWNNNPSRHAFGNIYCVRVNNSWVRGSMNQVPRDDAAAGGYDTLAGFAIAKNVITIGAMRAPSTPSSTLKREDVLATEFSSFGPTDDGRIKPDVILHGVSLVSPTIPRSCEDRTTPCGPGTSQVARDAYDLMSGTSMASPVAAGIGALLNELATRRYNRPLFANEMKAVLVHTALSAHADDSPDYSVGWGAVRANFAGHLITGKEGRLTSIDVSPGALRQLSFKWVPNKLGRITAVWLDDPGIADNFGSAPNDRSRKLVKDVDLVLESPSGKKYFAWSLDPDDPAKPATNTDVNTRDNVERIDVPIQQYEPGTWRLSISSHVPLGTTIQPASVAIATYGFEP
jgi:hypothetical protein